ncbi:hypothetical protein L207DRAFT_591233 [Hyaloscypha variabilis F]|uniref:Uncharacterized protein n=1 Tax=Hyaloscypha variabilis (strain UAMH 11265 / GT02V1 / F) TaxID=1149755 RepID=A0A2J6QZW1_HYAVF|nr:hypothetical protein L207DRAFT_591233 [Hyaloscypha variabilis F]
MVLVLFSLGFVELARGTATCYFPSGKISDGMPCNSSTTGQSACCNLGNLCMSSGLCFDKGLIARGSCTDATWTDDSCAKSCVDWDTDSSSPIIPHSWGATAGDVDTMRWCCGFPLANGSCPQGSDIPLQAGTVLEDTTTTGDKADCVGVCEASHDVAIGLGVGIPTIIACLSILLLYLRERRARRKEMRKPNSPKNDEDPWIKQHRSEGHSVTTITSDASPWTNNRVEAYAGPRIPNIELEEIPWRSPRRELP